MAVIYREDLTAAEKKMIEEHGDGYHDTVEFWIAFDDCQRDSNCRNRWKNCEAAEAWDRGWEAWTRVRLGRTPWPWNEYDRDDSDSLKQIASLRWVAKEYQRRKAEQLKKLPLAIADMATGAANDNALG
jgi:hypothetical protein